MKNYCLFILCVLVLYHPDKSQGTSPLLGRPDGHEQGHQQIDQAEGDDNRPLLGRRDGHEPGSWQENSKDASDDDSDEDSEDYVIEDKEPDYYETDGGEDEEEEYNWPSEDDQEPLVRCKRPMCSMYCADGFETDASGCPICQCKQSNSSLIGRPDGHERPNSNCSGAMCQMYCENGFKTGTDGCPICECSESEHGGPLGRPDGHEPISDCENQPMCAMYCELGFQTDERGCPVCSCLENPCQTIDCAQDSVCQSQPCESRLSCTRLSATCVAVQKPLPCPEPMCANACPDGYLKNEQGCMTCQCATVPAERLCGAITCEKGQICRNSTDTSAPKCTVKTICEMQRERPAVLGGASLQCEADGSFKALQCNPKQADCWCVDGFGQEVIGTRATVYVEEHKPKCVRNITISMHIHLTLVVKHDIDITTQLGSLNTTLVDHVSSWLLIEPHYIKVVKAEPISSERNEGDDEDDSSNLDDDKDDYSDELGDELDGSHQLVVEFVVIHDGQSDLPSAANYMRQRMHDGLCDIPVDKGSLLPNPYSLKTEHQFAQPLYEPAEVTGEEDRCVVDPDSWHCWRGQGVGICTVGTALITVLVVSVLVTVGVIASVCYRRRVRNMAFRHRVLDSQVSVERSFLDDDFDKTMNGGSLDKTMIGDSLATKDEKLPIA